MPLALAASLVLFVSHAVRADSWRNPVHDPEDAREDQLAGGDIDEEDPTVVRLGSHDGTAVSAHTAHSASWLSLVGFHKQLASGQNDVGGLVVLGLALDRLAAGPPSRRPIDPPRPEPEPSVPAPSPPAQPQRIPLMAPSLARACVAASLRASGLGGDDAAIDALISRARVSAWLPETRTRAMRLEADTARATTLATTDGTNYYQTVGAHLVLELRLTWHFDRLLYAGDEPSLERTRLARQEARSRLAGRTLEVLFAWQRAVVGARAAVVGSDEELQAQLRASEAQATLDVLTNGWFSRRDE